MQHEIPNTGRIALLYDEDVDIRFSDVDAYGHVNAKHYIDYVLASRWLFLARKAGVTIEECKRRGLGFYMVRSEVDYKRSIQAVDKVKVQSFVSELVKVRLTVSFEISDCKTASIYAIGKLFFAIMDTNTNRPQLCPLWAQDLFSRLR